MDEQRYSRQSHAIGKSATLALSNSTILVLGYNPLAQEIIKNLLLSGVGVVYVTIKDIVLSLEQKTNIYFKTMKEFKVLNPYCEIIEYDEKIHENYPFDFVIQTNTTIKQAIQKNKITRDKQQKFIYAGCYGLMGFLFNDFLIHEVKNVDGVEPKILIIDEIEYFNDENKTIIKCKFEHNLIKNDILNVELVNEKNIELECAKIITPYIFEINISTTDDIKSIIKKVKSATIIYQNLETNILEPSFSMGDFSNHHTRNKTLLEMIKTKDDFKEKIGRDLRIWSNVDYKIFKGIIANEISSKTTNITDSKEKSGNNIDSKTTISNVNVNTKTTISNVNVNTKTTISNVNTDTKTTISDFELISEKFCYTAFGDFLPMSSIVAGTVVHEIIKAISKNNIPVKQWQFFDCFHIITEDDLKNTRKSNMIKSNYESSEHYKGLISIFGKSILSSIQQTKPFVIGSGAIGCELIKHLANLGTREICITDNDNIEKSNLSRQFLFHDCDIGKSKSLTASSKVSMINPDPSIKVIPYQLKLHKDTENIFNDTFHQNIDFYLNALDNVEARKYVDRKAIYYEKPLIDSGTLGASASIQVVIPNLTITYNSIPDQVEKSIPICTIKSYPVLQEHTIQWARELFEEEFNTLPLLIEKLRAISNDELENYSNDDLIKIIKQISRFYGFLDDNSAEKSFDGITFYISSLIYEHMYYNINNLVNSKVKPEELKSVNMPNCYTLDELNNIITENDFKNIKFVVEQMFENNNLTNSNDNLTNSNDNLTNSNDNLTNSNDNLTEKKFKILPHNMDFPISPFSNKENDINTVDREDLIIFIEKITNSIPKLKAITFEKDDEKLKHIDFITTLSNLRNIQYRIQISTKDNVHKISGKIIPAMITTTSVIVGYQIIEYINVIKTLANTKQKKYLPSYFNPNNFKNRQINLNKCYNSATFVELAPKYKLNNINLTLWDKFYVQSKKTKEIVEHIERLYGVPIFIMTCGNTTIYQEKVLVEEINSEDLVELMYEEHDVTIPILAKATC